jgi:hypothetical protein
MIDKYGVSIFNLVNSQVAYVITPIPKIANGLIPIVSILLPIYLQNLRGFSALDSGLLMLPGALVMGALGIITIMFITVVSVYVGYFKTSKFNIGAFILNSLITNKVMKIIPMINIETISVEPQPLLPASEKPYNKAPMLNLEVLKYPTYTLTTVINMIVMMSLYGGMILLPIYLQNLRGFSLLMHPEALIDLNLTLRNHVDFVNRLVKESYHHINSS